jgi:Mor family transcriptional regulator
MGRKGDRRLHQFIDDLVAIGLRELPQHVDATPEVARELMTAIAHQVCFAYARTSIYVPAAMELTLTPRDEDIWRKYGQEGPDGVRPYTAARIQQLAGEYGMTERHLYNIVRMMRELETRKRQLPLPGIVDGI